MTFDLWRSWRFGGSLLCLCFSLSCADLSRGPAPDGGAPASTDGAAETSPADGAAVAFATAVHPLLISGCQRCHATGQQAGDTQYLLTGDVAADYAAAMRFVDTSAPTTSRLLAKMSGHGHDGGTVYAQSAPEYQTILSWIEQGARP